MDMLQAKAVVEAILFAMGDSVEVSKLADVTELTVKEIKGLLVQMQARPFVQLVRIELHHLL